MLRDEFANGGDKINRDLHRGVSSCFERRLVLGDRLFIALRLIALKETPDSGFIPSGRELALLRHGFLPRRRRSARFAFGPSSYAVITNTESGSGSGT